MKCVRNEHFSKSLHERAFSQLIPVAGTQIPEPDPVTFCVVATVTVTVMRHAVTGLTVTVTESQSHRHGTRSDLCLQNYTNLRRGLQH